nr:uncharacterized protein LOC111422577 [Onthophagus taurus]
MPINCSGVLSHLGIRSKKCQHECKDDKQEKNQEKKSLHHLIKSPFHKNKMVCSEDCEGSSEEPCGGHRDPDSDQISHESEKKDNDKTFRSGLFGTRRKMCLKECTGQLNGQQQQHDEHKASRCSLFGVIKKNFTGQPEDESHHKSHKFKEDRKTFLHKKGQCKEDCKGTEIPCSLLDDNDQNNENESKSVILHQLPLKIKRS